MADAIYEAPQRLDERWPVLRLFRTARRAVDFKHLLLGLIGVAAAYVSGLVIDRVWVGAGGGVAVMLDDGRPQSELYAYSELSRAEFALSREALLQRYREAAERAAKLATDENRKLLRDVKALVDEKYTRGRKQILEDESLTPEQRDIRLAALRVAVDQMNLLLAGKPRAWPQIREIQVTAIPLLAAIQYAPAQPTSGETAPPSLNALELFNQAVALQRQKIEAKLLRPQGPFWSLIDYEMSCFAAATRSVLTLNWGYGGGVSDARPSLVGSLFSAGSGLMWISTQRPWFLVVIGLTLTLIFSLCGGTICRSAALQAAREINAELGDTMAFVREKYLEYFLAAVMLDLFFIAIGAVLVLGALGFGLLSAIPGIGGIFLIVAGMLFGLALLGAVGLTMVLLAEVFGWHLLWPTISVEGSDAFDAVQHAAGYAGQGTWRIGLYSLGLLIYGAIAFIMVRIVALLLLKLAHMFAGAGLDLFGAVTSDRTLTWRQFDALWHMPSWSELPLLPTVHGIPFWGQFGHVPLSGTEAIAAWFIAVWVFLVVAAVGAFIVSFYFCGSVEMYLLLRRDIDGVDFEEIYVEGEEEGPSSLDPNDGESGGTSLPVVGDGPPA